MTSSLAHSGVAWDSSLGCFVSDAHVHLASVLQDYNSYFSLEFVPPKDREATDTKPWRIVDNTPGAKRYVMRWLSDEDMKRPSEVLEWIFNGDQSKHSTATIAQRIQSREAAEKLLDIRQQEEDAADRQDLLAFAVSSRTKHTWTHDGHTYRR